MGWLKKAVGKVVNVASQVATGGLLKLDKNGLSAGVLADPVSQVATGGLLKLDKNGLSTGVSADLALKGISTITGARAMEKSMLAQADQQRAEQARSSLISDALANAESNTETGKVNFRKKRSTNKISNSAGLGGVSQADSTGVQS